MIGPDGSEYPVKGVFREIVPLMSPNNEATVTSERELTITRVFDAPRGLIGIG